MFGCLFGEIKIYIPLYVLVYRAVKTDFGHFISLDKMNCVFSLNKYNNILSFWLLASARKFSVCPKNDGFAGLRGPGQPLARTSMRGAIMNGKPLN